MFRRRPNYCIFMGYLVLDPTFLLCLVLRILVGLLLFDTHNSFIDELVDDSGIIGGS